VRETFGVPQSKKLCDCVPQKRNTPFFLVGNPKFPFSLAIFIPDS
jgi:hypothetical protein